VSAGEITGPSAGRCIYCGTRDGKLHKEHIVPLSLGGKHVLPDASCLTCQKLINEKVEQPLLKGMLAPLRIMHAYPSRKRSTKTLPRTRFSPHDPADPAKGGRFETRPISTEDLEPFTYNLMRFSEPPRLLSGASFEDPAGLGLVVHIPKGAHADSSAFKLPSMEDMARLAFMLTKIAIGHLWFTRTECANIVQSCWQGKDPNWIKYVGTSENPPEPFPGLPYGMATRREREFFVVSVLLFHDALHNGFAHDVVAAVEPPKS
jgi:hypothetical protein